MSGDEELEQGTQWQAIDLLLEQGTREELDAMRRQVGADPMLALDLADTVTVLEQMRQLRTEASPRFAGRLDGVVRQAERYHWAHFPSQQRRWHLPLLMAASAALTFVLLRATGVCEWLLLDERSGAPDGMVVTSLEPSDSQDSPWHQRFGQEAQRLRVRSEAVRERAQLDWEQAMGKIRQRLEDETSPELSSALRAGLDGTGDPLGQWLEPSNEVELSWLAHELRADPDRRVDALLRRGALAAVDGRVQELADGIAESLDALGLDPDAVGVSAVPVPRERLESVAWSMRALIGAGSNARRVQPLRDAGKWLAVQLPDLHGEDLVWALSGLAELAAISGQQFEAVAEHGARMVEEVLVPDDERWSRRRPELLGGRVDARALGEAGRILSRLPAFGVDARRCQLVRQLVLGQLRERRAYGQDRPEVLAAMLYGCRDLLDGVSQTDASQADGSSEADRLGRMLRRWRLERLSPDFRAVQQIAWSLRPGQRGFTALQRELRSLSVLAAPQSLRERAAFCLCLSTNFASFVGALLPEAEPRRSL